MITNTMLQNQMTQDFNPSLNHHYKQFDLNQSRFQKEMEATHLKLVLLDDQITHSLRTYPREQTACSVLAHKTYTYLPEIITNPRLRIAQFKNILNPYEGELRRVYSELREEIKLQLLESKDIPKYASVLLDCSELLLKVKGIQLTLVLIKTQHGYQWAIKKMVYQQTLKDKKYRQYCLSRLWEYFLQLFEQLNDLDQKYHDYEYAMENFLSFISYCCYEVSKYFAIAKLLKLGRIKQELVYSYPHIRKDKSSVEYSFSYSMPTASDLGNIADFLAKSITLKCETENQTISIVFELQDSMVCETSIQFIYTIGQDSVHLTNNFYKGSSVSKKLTKEYIGELVEAAEQIRVLYVQSYLKMQKLETILAQPGLLIKPFDGFCYSQGNILTDTRSFVNNSKKQKLYLFTFQWSNKQIFYEIDPFTLQLKDYHSLQISLLPDKIPKTMNLLEYDRYMSIRMKHSIIKKYLFQNLHIQNFKITNYSEFKKQQTIHLSFLLVEQTYPRGSILTPPNNKSNKNFVLKFHEDCQYFDNFEICINAGLRDLRLEDFLVFSNLREADQFSLQIMVKAIIDYIDCFEEIYKSKKFKERAEKEKGGLARISFTRQ